MVEVGGQEVPEELGPKECFDAGEDLVGGRGEDDEAGPVVFDQFSHGTPTSKEVMRAEVRAWSMYALKRRTADFGCGVRGRGLRVWVS